LEVSVDAQAAEHPTAHTMRASASASYIKAAS
jgi:hypothetical protein